MGQQKQVARRAYRAVVHRSKQATQFEKVRFAMVGVANTITDFAVLLSLVAVWGMNSAAANIISTTCALAVSFVLNKKTVFRSDAPMKMREVIVFVAVTLAGIWLVQTVIMSQVFGAFVMWSGAKDGMVMLLLLVIAKVIGIVAGSIWNYVWYSRVVFKRGAA